MSLTPFLGYMQGSGGGPSEGNVSGYLLRSTSTNWAKDSILAVDAGTHLAGIIQILEDHHQALNMPPPSTSSPTTPLSPSTSIPGKPYNKPILPNGASGPSPNPFSGCPLPAKSPKANASFISRDLVSTFLLTHTHLDHISGFVINTASFSHTCAPKRVAALPAAINAIKTHIFNDVIWPNLSDEDSGAGLVTYQRLPISSPTYSPVCDGSLSVQAWPVSHGHCMKRHTHFGRLSDAGLTPSPPTWCVLDSAVFFIRDEKTGQEVMMWGDVEPDSLSLDPRNRAAWTEAAAKITAGTLTTIFIECSYVNSHRDDCLYGHLSPKHLIMELQFLAESVAVLRSGKKRKRSITSDASAGSVDCNGMLRGLKVVITHVKDTLEDGVDVVDCVHRDLKSLEELTQFGCEFVMARKGASIYF